MTKRKKLPRKRRGSTTEARIGGIKLYVSTGEYQDGKLGELFLDAKKPGSFIQGLLTCFAISVSLGLQHDVALEKYVRVFREQRFEPFGVVDHPDIKQASSIVDLVFQILERDYLHQQKERVK